jgi:hypothetical protein
MRWSERFSGRARETPAPCVARPKVAALREADPIEFWNSLTTGGCVQITDLEWAIEMIGGIVSIRDYQFRENSRLARSSFLEARCGLAAQQNPTHR